MIDQNFMRDYSQEEEIPEFMEITDKELEVIGNIREQIMKSYGADVTGDVADIDENTITVVYTVDEKDQVVTFNRLTLQWDI